MLEAHNSIEALVHALAFGGSRGWSNEDADVLGWKNITAAHQAVTMLDITGAGMLTGITTAAGTGSYEDLCIQVDGGPIYWLRCKIRAAYPLLIPFTTSLKVTSLSSGNFASAVLNGGSKKDKWSDYTAVLTGSTAVAEANTILDVSGNGVILCATFPGTSGKATLQVDDGSIYSLFSSATGTNAFGFLIPFKTRFVLKADSSWATQLKFLTYMLS